MKVPGADYTQIRQAQQARTNAMVGAYAAKDASHAISRYNTQKESIDNSRTANNVNLVLGIANIGVNLAQSLYSEYKQEEENRQKNQFSTATDVYNARGLEKVAEYGTKAFKEYVDPETGEKTLVMNAELERDLRGIYEETFGSQDDWNEDYWNIISSNRTIFEAGLRTQALSVYNQSLAEANATAFDNNVTKLLNEGVNNYFDGSTVHVTVPDGAGKTRAMELPITVKTAIDTYYDNEADRQNAYAKYATKFAEDRAALITQNHLNVLRSHVNLVSEGQASGEDIQESWAQCMAAIEALYPDPNDRKDAIKALQGQHAAALDELINTIIMRGNDNGEPGWAQVSKAYEGFNPEGDKEDATFYSYFFDKDGKAMAGDGKWNATKDYVYSLAEQIQENYGTVATAEIQEAEQAALKSVKDTLEQIKTGMGNGSIGYLVATNTLKDALEAAYPDGTWMTNPEVYGILTKFYKDVAGDMAKDSKVKSWIDLAVSNVLFGEKGGDKKAKDISELSLSQQVLAEEVTTNFMAELTMTLANDPTMALDPDAMSRELMRICNIYSHSWFSNFRENDYNLTATNKDATAKAENMIMSLFSPDAEDFDVLKNGSQLMQNRDEDGWIQGADIKLATGSRAKFDEGVARIRQQLEAETNSNLDGLEVQMGEVGGKLVPVALRFTHKEDHTKTETYYLGTYSQQPGAPEPPKTEGQVMDTIDDNAGGNVAASWQSLDNEEARNIIAKWAEDVNTQIDTATVMINDTTTEEGLDALVKWLEENEAFVKYDWTIMHEEAERRREEIRNPEVEETQKTPAEVNAEHLAKERDEQYKWVKEQYGEATADGIYGIRQAKTLEELEEIYQGTLKNLKDMGNGNRMYFISMYQKYKKALSK